MRRLALVIVLSCVLSGVARAGEIHSTGAVAPPPPSTMTIAGEIPSTGATVPQPIPGEIHTTGATAPNTLLAIVLTFISIGR